MSVIPLLAGVQKRRAAPAPALSTTLLQGLASHYLLGEASGATRVDSHGVEDMTNVGTVGQTTGVGGVGNAALFDGNVANYLSRADGVNVQTGDIDFTFNVWVNLANTTSLHMIFAKWNDVMFNGDYELFYFNTDHRFHWDICNGTTTADTAVANTFGAPSASTWYMVTVAHDATNNRLGIRVNAGAWDWVNTTVAPATTATPLQVGHRANTTFTMNGAVQYLSLWKGKVLSDAEVASLYGSGTPNVYPFLGGSALYSIVNTTDSGGQNIRILVPNNHVAGTSYPLVLYHHGVGESQTAITADTLKLGVIRNLSGEGYIIAGTNAHGENWGNSASLTDYLNLYNYLNSNYSLYGRTVHFSQSMGGQSGLLSVVTDFVTIPNTKGWIGCYPVCNLADMFDGNAGTYAADIRAAYGIAADGSDYAAKTAGHDPVLLTASKFDGLRMRFYASAADAVVDKTANSDAMQTLVTGHATEYAVVACAGAHGDPSHFRPVDYSTFANRCV